MLVMLDKKLSLKIQKLIKSLRKKYGFSQARWAKLSHVDAGHIQRLESSTPVAVRLDTIIKLAKGLNLSVSEFLDGL